MNEGHRSDAKQSLVLACLFHHISVRGVPLPSFATTLVFLVPFHLVLTSLHQPLVHSCINQVNPDRHSERLSIPRFYLASLQCLRCYSPGENRSRTQSNNPDLYCLMPFLGLNYEKVASSKKTYPIEDQSE